MNVVDSSGWIEYFLDSARADLFATAIESNLLLVVPVISIYEVYKFLVKQTTEAIVFSQAPILSLLMYNRNLMSHAITLKCGLVEERLHPVLLR